MNEARRLGILVGGGPAPGINSAISSATIEACNRGLSVLGIYDGFEHLVADRRDMVRELTISACVTSMRKSHRSAGTARLRQGGRRGA